MSTSMLPRQSQTPCCKTPSTVNITIIVVVTFSIIIPTKSKSSRPFFSPRLIRTEIPSPNILHLDILSTRKPPSHSIPCESLVKRPPRLLILLHPLHKILVRRPVHPPHALHNQIHNDERRKRKQQRRPPAELAAKVVQKRVADNIFAGFEGVHAREEEAPEEPARDGDEEAGEGDDGFVVEFEDAAQVGVEQ
ncbi:hypothetical protein E4U61_005961, partial [Claviceps capensis]